jgi:hypothetical protein
MEKRELIQLTDVETIRACYAEVLGERVHSDGSHPLYNKGVLDGMEIMLLSMQKSMTERKKLAN